MEAITDAGMNIGEQEQNQAQSLSAKPGIEIRERTDIKGTKVVGGTKDIMIRSHGITGIFVGLPRCPPSSPRHGALLTWQAFHPRRCREQTTGDRSYLDLDPFIHTGREGLPCAVRASFRASPSSRSGPAKTNLSTVGMIGPSRHQTRFHQLQLLSFHNPIRP